jgi:hypothetical protein
MPGDYDIEYASPWAGANYLPVGGPGSLLQKCEIATWPELDRICREIPEAGIHHQHTVIYGRTKDRDSATGQWFRELVKEDAWFRDVVPDVSFAFSFFPPPFQAIALSPGGYLVLYPAHVSWRHTPKPITALIKLTQLTDAPVPHPAQI